MNKINPYNCTKPGNLFVGYERLRHQLLSGFRNGHSFAILGGRRCGKTSLLMQIEKDLQNEGLAPYTPLPRYLDIQGLDKPTLVLLFETIYSLIVRDSEAKPWTPGESGKEYQDFLDHMETAKPILDQRYGPDWLVVLLVDELDTAIVKLSDDQFFQNLRNLLMLSRFHNHLRLVASGVKEMASLIASGSSPLNNLRNKHLGILTSKQARQIIAYGFHEGLDPEVEFLLLQLTGRHPYLLQGISEKLWEAQTELDEKSIKYEAKEFLDEHNDFHRWVQTFNLAEHAIYQLLSEAPGGTLHVREIRHRLGPTFSHQIDEALTVLSYHGVIDDSEPDKPLVAGTMFREWFRDNKPRQNKNSGNESPPPIRLFYSYSHKDESMRDALETHLAVLKRQGTIVSWHDRRITPGEEWKGQISKHLEEADIVLLLVSADFLASDYCCEIELKHALKRHEAGEAFVIPIIIRYVDWTETPFTKMQALPRDAKPVNGWDDQDEAWADVVKGIRRAVNQLRKLQRPR